MTMLTTLSLVLLLPALAAAQAGCSYEGKSYAHLDPVPHANGCTKFQCQNGTVVVNEEACGKEVDSNCHLVNVQFIFRNNYYVCRKTTTGGIVEYKNEPAPPPAAYDCTAEGKQFKHLEQFKLSDGCRTYQCQDGTVVLLSPEACGKELDGSCHLLDSWVSKNGIVKKCDKSQVNGQTVFQYVELTPQPDLTKTAQYNGKRYASLEYYNTTGNPCELRQSQNGQGIYLTQFCQFVQDNNKCYDYRTQFEYKGKRYECALGKVTNGKQRYQVKRVKPKLRNCTVGSNTYQHLEIFQTGNGCQTSQCYNGRVVDIQTTCKDVSGQCYSQNWMWKIGADVYQCFKQDPWGWTVARIFVPVCEEPGKDVIFALDESGSITAPNFQKQKEFSAQLTRRFRIGTDATKAEFLFAAVKFASETTRLFNLNTHFTGSALYQSLLGVSYGEGGTRTDKALNYIVSYKMFDPAYGGRPDAGNIAVVVTDGQSNEPALTQQAASVMRSSGVQILCVGIGPGVNNAELLGMAGDSSNVFHVDSYDVLDQVEDKISYRVCKAQ